MKKNQCTVIFLLLLGIVVLFLPSIIGCEASLFSISSPTSKKIKIEYDFQGIQNDEDRWDRSSTENTYSDANVKLEVASTVEKLAPTTTYLSSTNSDCENLRIVDGMLSRTENIESYPIYLQLSDGVVEEDFIVSTLAGLSNNYRFNGTCTGLRNWSIVWYGNIIAHNQGKNFQSILNRTIDHELLHQVGNVFDNDAHCVHDFADIKENCNKCTLWGGINEGYDFNDLANTITKFEICPRHIQKLKDGPDLIQEHPFPSSISGNETFTVCGPPCTNSDPRLITKYDPDFKISLSKDTYKAYEPILIMFEYVNNNLDTAIIRENFEDNRNETNFLIEGPNGKTSYTRRAIRGEYFNVPKYYVPPKDTFMASMTLNYRHGEELKESEQYFGLYRYLEPGHYSVIAQTTINNKEYTSNKIEFTIAELNSEDRTVLNLITENKMDELQKNYSFSVFMEHALMRDVSTRHGMYNETHFPNREEILNDYKSFFDKFSNSYYITDSRFLNPFLGRLAYSSDHFLQDINNLKNDYKGTLLSKLFSQNSFINDYYNRFKRSQNFIKGLHKK